MKRSNWFLLLLLLCFVMILACEKEEEEICYDCRILTTFTIRDTVIVCDTIQVWCNIDPRWFEQINTYEADYPEQNFSVQQIVTCK